MSRHRPSGANSFKARLAPWWHHHREDADYEISWTVDFYYPSSRLRFPRRFSRITTRAGAEKFVQRHRLAPLPPIEPRE